MHGNLLGDSEVHPQIFMSCDVFVCGRLTWGGQRGDDWAMAQPMLATGSPRGSQMPSEATEASEGGLWRAPFSLISINKVAFLNELPLSLFLPHHLTLSVFP